jgi:G3E family GTPase
MRTPVVLVAGQGDTDAVVGALLQQPGTLVIEHRFDGHVVLRTVVGMRHGVLSSSAVPLELVRGCVACTIRNDLLVLLRRLHRRDDVHRIVVHLAPWLEPEPICRAIAEVRVHVGPGYLDGPAARDVEIAAVVVAVDGTAWLPEALGEDELDDGRTVAQVAVGQVEFADVVVLDRPEPTLLAVLRRLAPRARITTGVAQLELALAHLESNARRGRSDHPHGPLLAGQPPLEAHGPVQLFEFHARRPFHPDRLHTALDVLLEGVVRARGRLWLASRHHHVMWLETAGGGLHVESAGKWLAAMTASEVAYVDADRRVFADLLWEYRFGDRHTSITVLACGASPVAVDDTLRAALLTDDELAAPDEWAGYPDPFGDWHTDPCAETTDGVTARGTGEEGTR